MAKTKATKPMTNNDLVTEMMNFSEYGMLKQVFILEAIYKYSQETLKDTSEWESGSLISQDAWKDCAQECIDAINKRNLQYQKTGNE